MTGKPIVIADYDPSWPERFRSERDLIHRTCGRDSFTRIEHVGSTAVPGLAAKPIIDMMPGLRTLVDAPPLIPMLASIGYEYVPEYERPIPELNDPGMPFRRYFRKDIAGRRAVHLHMVEQGSDFWRDHLLFRDHLRTHPADRHAYEDMKRRVAAEYNANLRPGSRLNLGYTDRKSDLIAEIMTRARVRETHPPIVLSEYDPAWKGRFERARAEILRVAADAVVAIEHVGSTAVPGMTAKPIIDMALGVRSLDDGRRIQGPLEALGYHRHRAEDQGDDWRVFHRHAHAAPGHGHAQQSEDFVDVYHLHMVPHGGERWRRYLAFREAMCGDPAAARAYGDLKRDLAAEFGGNRLGYTEAKTDFVEGVLRRAGFG
jgi:GrpB-like predicted nucleotidyltransferase (UPF0157 family)